MEDILASIRRIIADDQSRQPGAPGQRPSSRLTAGAAPLPLGAAASPTPAAAAPAPGRPTGPSGNATPDRPGTGFGPPRPSSFTSQRPIDPAARIARPLPPMPGRIGSGASNGSTPHMNPPQPDPSGSEPSVFQEIASVGAASALRMDAPPPPATVIELTPLGAAPVDAGTEQHARSEPTEADAAHGAPAPPVEIDVPAAADSSAEPQAAAEAPTIDTPAAPPEGKQEHSAEPLVSPAAFTAIEQSFQALAASMVMQNSGQLDIAVREMLRPMLKGWLDDNLPAIVERLVRAEIERVARGGRA